MKNQHSIYLTLLVTLSLMTCVKPKQLKDKININDMMIRIAEIDLDSNYIEEYLEILKEESEASIRIEPGVICIYPMYEKEHPAQIRLLEIYTDRKAYESHLESPHFQKYKTSTSEMVKSLKLIDMEPIDPATMPQLFRKIEFQE